MTPEQLKASILQRAMEGKLVPQDPNDEPASELLKRIKAEKEKLIAEGKIKRDKNETEIFRGDDGLHYEKFSDDTIKEIEVPFDIPNSWEWVRLGSIIHLVSGRDLASSEYTDTNNNGIPYITGASNFKNGKITSNRFTNKPSVVSSRGDLLITVKGTIGEMAINPFLEAHIARQVMAITSYNTNLNYIEFGIKSFLTSIKASAQSMIPGISREVLLGLLFPVAPSREQEQIVRSVNDGLLLVEKYSHSYSLLQQLDNEFPEKLRKSILQYAMQGKLVPQDPNDEPVEALLEKIHAEKQRLFEEGKLKKKDLQESIIYKGDDNSYYEKTGKSDNHIAYDLPTIPKTWEWIRLNLAISSNIGLTFKPNNVTSHGVPILKANNIRNGQINFEEVTHVSYDTKIKSTEWLSIGDVLMAVRSGSKNLVGKSAVIHDLNDEPTSFGAFMSVIRPLKIEPEYLTIFFESAFFRNQLEEANTTTIYQVTQKMLKESFFPLAPLTEQNRILNRVEQLSRKISELG